MSCWVVPSVAAEFWGVPLDVVWARIYAGQVPHKRDGGFVFVDVEPWRADFNGIVYHTPPMTYTAAGEADDVVLVDAEAELLTCDVPEAEEVWEEDPCDNELPPLDDEESATLTRFSWEESRRRVGRTRIPPRAA